MPTRDEMMRCGNVSENIKCKFGHTLCHGMYRPLTQNQGAFRHVAARHHITRYTMCASLFFQP